MSDHYTTVIFNCQDCTFAYIEGLMTNLMCPPKEITIVNAFFETKQPNKASLLTPTHEHLPPRQFNSYKSPYDCGHHLLLLLMSWLILLHYLLLVHSSQPTTTHPVPALPSFVQWSLPQRSQYFLGVNRIKQCQWTQLEIRNTDIIIQRQLDKGLLTTTSKLPRDNKELGGDWRPWKRM